MTGSRGIHLRRGCNTITPPMPTRDGKVTILDKWEGGFGQVDPYEVHLLQSMYATGFTWEIWSWRRLHSWVVDFGARGHGLA